MKQTQFRAMRRLGEGSSVALVTPSGVILDKSHVEHAEENVRSLGWIPVRGANVRASLGYLAGTDEERLADLNTAILDDSVDAIWCVRGGYGAMRLLPLIDYAALKRN